MGFSYITTKKFKQWASADVDLMFTAYNIRRIMNVLGKNELMKYLKEAALLFSGKTLQISIPELLKI